MIELCFSLRQLPLSLYNSSYSTMSEQYGGPHETRQERETKVRQLDLSVWDLFDPKKPWVLVPDGSLLGIFDFVRIASVFRSFKVYVLSHTSHRFLRNSESDHGLLQHTFISL